MEKPLSLLKRFSKSIGDLSEFFSNPKVVEIKIDQTSNDKDKKQSEQYKTSQQRRNPKGIPKPISLVNIGANCYLNSALQSISSCDKFIEDITKIHLKHKDLDKLSVFYNLIIILHDGSKYSMDISRNSIFKHWNKSGQQDSFELLTYVINQVYNEIRHHKEITTEIPNRNLQEWLRIPLPMRLLIQYKIVCPCGKDATVPLHSDLALHVTVPLEKTMDLQSLIELHFKEDKIYNYKCDSVVCDGISAKKITKLITPLPRTMCIHLQKSYWDGYKMKKITNRINFSTKLIIKSEYCTSFNDIDSEVFNSVSSLSASLFKSVDFSSLNFSDSLSKSQSKPNNNRNSSHSTKIDSQNKNTGRNSSKYLKNSSNNKPGRNLNKKIEPDKLSNHEFCLCSVIVHHGTVSGGHYICYKCIKGQWYLTNDFLVQEVQEDKVLKSDPYILIYEQI